MDAKKLQFYKNKLLELKNQILNGKLLKPTEDLLTSSEDLAEEGDLANSIINQNVSVHLREQELSKLRYINEALENIANGTYGQCVDCDEEISESRLNNQPWTDVCLTHAEEREKKDARRKKIQLA
jgi:DnaK suppressor protein